VHLDYHVGPLRRLGVLEFADPLYASEGLCGCALQADTGKALR